MPTKRCSWGTCNSDSRYPHRPLMVGVTFYTISKAEDAVGLRQNVCVG